jgi:WD40 repeat protein
MSEPVTRVFVSYRRRDSPGHAGRIRDALVARFGHGNVFYDLASVQGGANFAEVIENAIAESTVVLAIVGPRWRRVSVLRSWLGENDWVSTELNLAGRSRKPVLPIMVNGATAASLRNLPDPVSYLSSINAFLVRDESWDADIRQLVEQAPVARPTYPPVLTVAPRRRRRPLLWVSAVLVVAALLITVVSLYLNKPAGANPAGTNTLDSPSSRNGTPPTPTSFVGPIAHTGEVLDVAFSPNGKWIATAGGNSHTMTLWDAATGARVKQFAGDRVVAAVAFSRDGRRVATDDAIFEIESGERYRLVNGGYAVAFSPDSKLVANASGYAPPGVRLFDQATGALVKQISDEYAKAVAFNHDGTLVAAASGYLAKGVHVWSVADSSLITTLQGPSEAVAFSADGKYIATAGGGTVRVFRAATREALHDIPGQTVAFSADSRILATTGENRRVRLYDPANGDPIETLDVYATVLAFSPDGKRIVTASPDGSLQVTAIASAAGPTAPK